jgi:hypothetical protein
MRNRLSDSFAVIAAMLAFSAVTFAQTYGTPGYAPGTWKPQEVPKDLSKPKPYNPRDFSGVWSSPTKAGYFERHALNDKWLPIQDKSIPDQMRSQTYPPPLTDWGKAKFEETKPSYGPRSVAPGLGNDTVSTCDPMGYPRDLYEANLRPFEIIQAPDRMLIHMQYHEIWRQVWTDGRELPKDPDPAWMGYSIGKWDGDTFVITSTGYDERTWLDHLGNPHSDQMVLVERWKHPDANTLTLDMTITDPKTYTAPWVGETITFVRAKAAVFEELCVPSEEEHFNDRIRDAAVGSAKP